MEEGANGTVTSLASLFPVDEAREAAALVQDAIAKKRQELDRVKGFITDNAGLVGLVQKLPEELRHDVMLGDAKCVMEAIRKAMLKVLDFLYVTANLKGFEAAAAAGAEEVALFASASESFFQFKHKWQHGGES